VAGARETAYFPQPFLEARSGVVVSPFQFALDGNDNLRSVCVNAAAGVRIFIQGRRLTEAGTIEPFAFVCIPTADRQVTEDVFSLGKGALLNLAAFVTGATPLIGQTWVMLQIVRGFTGPLVLLGTLLQGYVTSSQGLGWPGSPIQSSTDSGGYYRTIAGTQPAAGAQVSEVVPTGARWEFLSGQFDFTASAAVANRFPLIAFRDPSYAIVGVPRPVVVTATQVVTLGVAPDFPFTQHATWNIDTMPVPKGLTLLAGQSIVTNVIGMQAGDQWGVPHYAVREWLEVP